ncbi:MAG: transcription termination factor Rho [Phycisphaerales bacterium JB063]
MAAKSPRKKKSTKKTAAKSSDTAVEEHDGPHDPQTDAEMDAETQARYEDAKHSDLTVQDLQAMDIEELHEVAKLENIEDFANLGKQDLIFKILQTHIAGQGLMYGEGVLEILPDGFGFLRSPEFSYLACPDDIYVSPSQIRRFGLKVGHVVQGTIRPPKESERYFALLRVDAINGQSPDKGNDLLPFEDLTPLHPTERYIMETTEDSIEMRIVDLVTPIGRGQRALIVAPPRTGKTVLLQKMAKSIITNYPECKVFVLLIDERPEEVTDFKANVPSKVEVVASTFDENTARHVQVCEMVMEKARRMVEYGEHVVILMDSITRMARAYNSEMPHSGKILTGGLDSNALQRPKKFFGSARAIEDGGSLTIIGTALVDTGSKADDIIFEEFKGTGNAELHLDRRLVEKRVYPAIDISASGTRREELLMDEQELKLVYRLRKVLADMNVVEAMELLKGRLSKARTNAEFLLTMSMEN